MVVMFGLARHADLARLGDGPAVEQELFREGGFARVGVGDDGEGSPPGDFVLKSGQDDDGDGALFRVVGVDGNGDAFALFVHPEDDELSRLGLLGDQRGLDLVLMAKVRLRAISSLKAAMLQPPGF